MAGKGSHATELIPSRWPAPPPKRANQLATSGQSDGHQREETLAAYGQNSMALDTRPGDQLQGPPP
ncbi:hypothetical protein EDM40_14740, partial [Staphylococcus aureus]